MRNSTRNLAVAGLALGLTSLACFSAADVAGVIGEPIPMATLALPSPGPFSWEPSPPVRVGKSNEVGSLTLRVTHVIRPANHMADDAMFYAKPKPDEEYMAVELTATCNLAPEEACHISTMEFGASGEMRISYIAEITMTGTDRPFESGELKGGKSRSGYLFFRVHRDDKDLVMIYPRTIGVLAPTGSFLLDD